MERPSPSASEEQYPKQVNRHQVRVEGDLLCIRYVGEYTAEDAHRILTIADQIYRQHGMVFLLGDVSQAEPPGPATRVVVAKWNYLGTYCAAMVGASLTIRTIVNLMTSAQRLLRRTPQLLAYAASSEADGSAWIDEQRRRQRLQHCHRQSDKSS